VGGEILRVTVLLTLVTVAITVVLPYLLTLAAATGR
jgi:hypothetical protein